MEEKIIIESKPIKAKHYVIEAAVWGGMIFILAIAVLFMNNPPNIGLAFILALLAIFVDFLIMLPVIFSSITKIIVTDKRICGRTMFGTRVDIPNDSISSVASGKHQSVVVASASGRIVFRYIGNKEEVAEAIFEIIATRQQHEPIQTTIIQDNKTTNADEIKKYKDLLDIGAITQEEFDAKKKELLGI